MQTYKIRFGDGTKLKTVEAKFVRHENGFLCFYQTIGLLLYMISASEVRSVDVEYPKTLNVIVPACEDMNVVNLAQTPRVYTDPIPYEDPVPVGSLRALFRAFRGK